MTEVVITGVGPAATDGTAELLTPPTLTATVPDDWSTSVFAEIAFSEAIQVAYTAPSAAALRDAGCDGPIIVRVGLLIDVVGDGGTHATIDPASELPFAQVSVPTISCPALAAPTPPRTDTAVAPEPIASDGEGGGTEMVALVVLLALGATLLVPRRWRAGWDSNPRPKD